MGFPPEFKSLLSPIGRRVQFVAKRGESQHRSLSLVAAARFSKAVDLLSRGNRDYWMLNSTRVWWRSILGCSVKRLLKVFCSKLLSRCCRFCVTEGLEVLPGGHWKVRPYDFSLQLPSSSSTLQMRIVIKLLLRQEVFRIRRVHNIWNVWGKWIISSLRLFLLCFSNVKCYI